MAEPSTVATAPPASTSGKSQAAAPSPVVAPAAPAPSVPATPAATTPAAEVAPDDRGFGSMLDDLVKSKDNKAAEANKQPEQNGTPPKPPEKAADLLETKPTLPGTPEITDDSSQFKTTPELRKEFYARSKKLKERESELQHLRTELETAKAPREDPEKKALAERLMKLEQDLSVREMELRSANYTKSEEYLRKFQKPYEDVMTQAHATVSEFTVQNDDGSSRQLTGNDFMHILGLPTQQAWDAADKLFGRAAPTIMGYRDKLRDLTRASQEESKRYREQGEIKDRDAMAAQTAQRENLKRRWQESNEKLAKQYPDFFAPDENDPEGNEWLKKGYDHVDRVFNGNGLTPEQRIEHEADIRNRAAGFGRLAYRLKKAEADKKALEEELASFRASTPRTGERDGEAPPAGDDDSFSSQLRKLTANRR